MLQSVDFLDIDINQSFQTLPNRSLILGLNEYLPRVLLFHRHRWSYLYLELAVLCLPVMFGLLQYRKDNIILLAYFALNSISLVVLRWRKQHLILPSLVKLLLIHLVNLFLWLSLQPVQYCLRLTHSFSSVPLLFEPSSLLIIVSILCLFLIFLLVTFLRRFFFEIIAQHSSRFFFFFLLLILSSFLSLLLFSMFFQPLGTASLLAWYIVFIDVLFLLVGKLLVKQIRTWVFALIAHLCSI